MEDVAFLLLDASLYVVMYFLGMGTGVYVVKKKMEKQAEEMMDNLTGAVDEP